MRGSVSTRQAHPQVCIAWNTVIRTCWGRTNAPQTRRQRDTLQSPSTRCARITASRSAKESDSCDSSGRQLLCCPFLEHHGSLNPVIQLRLHDTWPAIWHRCEGGTYMHTHAETAYPSADRKQILKQLLQNYPRLTYGLLTCRFLSFHSEEFFQTLANK
jgi:hypothetical protein